MNLARADHDRGDSFLSLRLCNFASLFAPTGSTPTRTSSSPSTTTTTHPLSSKRMNVSDLLQDSPSQHRKRPSGNDSTSNLTASTTSSSPAVLQPQSQNSPTNQPQPQINSSSSSPQSHTPRPGPATPNTQYPAPPSGPYYAPSPFVPQRITPRQQTDQPMASLQHPHPHSPWGPRTNSGSSPHSTTISTRAPLPIGLSFSPPCHIHTDSIINFDFGLLERSPVVQRPNVTPTGTSPAMRAFFSFFHTNPTLNPYSTLSNQTTLSRKTPPSTTSQHSKLEPKPKSQPKSQLSRP